MRNLKYGTGQVNYKKGLTRAKKMNESGSNVFRAAQIAV